MIPGKCKWYILVFKNVIDSLNSFQMIKSNLFLGYMMIVECKFKGMSTVMENNQWECNSHFVSFVCPEAQSTTSHVIYFTQIHISELTGRILSRKILYGRQQADMKNHPWARRTTIYFSLKTDFRKKKLRRTRNNFD